MVRGFGVQTLVVCTVYMGFCIRLAVLAVALSVESYCFGFRDHVSAIWECGIRRREMYVSYQDKFISQGIGKWDEVPFVVVEYLVLYLRLPYSSIFRV